MSSSSPASQLRDLLRLGFPIVLSMAALIGLGVTDTVMVGQVSAEDLAALAIGANAYFVIVMLLIGLQSIVAPRISRHLGAGQADLIAGDCWQSLWLGLGFGLAGMLLVLAALPLLDKLQLEPKVLSVATQYLVWISFTLPLVGINLALSGTFNGLGLTKITMYISVIAFFVNLVFDYLFVFGSFGFPKLGALGCVIASLAVVLFQTIFYWLLIHRHPDTAHFKIIAKRQLPIPARLKKLLWLGLPAAVAVTLEESFFASMSFLVAPLGTAALATHQVLLNIAIVCLIIPLGLAQAGAIAIGRDLGQGNPSSARQRSEFSLLLNVLVSMIVGIGIWFGREPLLQTYSTDKAVIALGVSVLTILSFQVVVDSLQISSNILLKGYQDTAVPAVLQGTSYWVIGFPLAWLGCFGLLPFTPDGITGIWVGMCIALCISAILGVSRLLIISRDFRLGVRHLPSQ